MPSPLCRHSALPFDPTVRKNADAFAEFSGNRSWSVENPEDARTPNLLVLERAFAFKHERQVEAAAA